MFSSASTSAISRLSKPAAAFEKAIDDLCRLYSFKPEVVACDLHPDYASTHWAETSGLPLIRIQHHQAHVAACAAENNVQGAYLGHLLGRHGIWPRRRHLGRRVLSRRTTAVSNASLTCAPLACPAAMPRSAKAGVPPPVCMLEVFGVGASATLTFGTQSPGNPRLDEAKVRYMLERGINVVPTTSVGRLFDAVACISGVARAEPLRRSGGHAPRK